MTSCDSESGRAITVQGGGRGGTHFLSQARTARRHRLFKGAVTISGNAFVFKVYVFVDILRV